MRNINNEYLLNRAIKSANNEYAKHDSGTYLLTSVKTVTELMSYTTTTTTYQRRSLAHILYYSYIVCVCVYVYGTLHRRIETRIERN